MARMYADENFDFNVVLELQNLGHDVLTALLAGQANQKIPDLLVLAHAISLSRAILTQDRDYVTLHKTSQPHCGIVFCSADLDGLALAGRIHKSIMANLPLDNKLLRIRRPAKP